MLVCKMGNWLLDSSPKDEVHLVFHLFVTCNELLFSTLTILCC